MDNIAANGILSDSVEHDFVVKIDSKLPNLQKCYITQ